MKKNIEILGVEQTNSKTGKVYWKVETSAGNMSCFEDVLAGKLNVAIGQGKVCVEIAVKGDFTNIREFYGEEDPTAPQPDVQAPISAGDKAIAARPSGPNQTMYTSYAKDVFIALLDQDKDMGVEMVMDHAIKLVQQARDAF